MFDLSIGVAWECLLRHIREGVWLIDAHGKVVAANPVVARWLEADLLGTDSNKWFVQPPAEWQDGEASVELTSSSGIIRRIDVVTESLKDAEGAVQARLQVFTDHSAGRAFDAALVEEVQRMARLAGEDPLTQLANRRAYNEALNHVRNDHRRRFGVIVIDLDDFKAINDTYGHNVGDRVLVAFAERLRGLVRGDDLVARIGGDEFAVLMPHVTMVGLTEAAERLRAGLWIEIEVQGVPLKVNASVGYAHSGPDPDTVVERADRWMYQHKASRESAGIAGLAKEEEDKDRRAG